MDTGTTDGRLVRVLPKTFSPNHLRLRRLSQVYSDDLVSACKQPGSTDNWRPSFVHCCNKLHEPRASRKQGRKATKWFNLKKFALSGTEKDYGCCWLNNVGVFHLCRLRPRPTDLRVPTFGINVVCLASRTSAFSAE